MTHCISCDKRLGRRTNGVLCASCRMRLLNSDPDINRARSKTRLGTLASQTPAERIARFRIVKGDDECWGWTGCHNGVGYPMMKISKDQRVATHVALEIDDRPRPSPEYVACHKCDNPPCTNPKHLWWGTEKQNMQDAASKGRLTGWSRQRGARRA